ncbi:MAG TPA: PAS domain S-box protein [Gallionella sp.]|nr:PAS domain S-box protein [Gallionella sp.]
MLRHENNQFADTSSFFTANQTLPESEVRRRLLEHQKLIQTSLDGFWVSRTTDARIVEANDAFCNMVGYSRDELRTMCVADLEANESPAETAAHIKKIMEVGYDRFETRHRHKQGHLIDLEVSVSYSTMNGGMNFVFVRDITERKRTEDALYFIAQRSWMGSAENFFDALAQYLGEALNVEYVVIDRLDQPGVAKTVAVYAKGEIVPNMRYDLKGTPCENVMGRTFCFYPRGIRQLFPDDALLVEMGAESYAGVPLWDSDDQPIGLIAVMDRKPLADEAAISRLLRLVAIRASAELERERCDHVLREREREFRSLAENLPDNVVRHNRQGEIVYVNPTLARTLGNDAVAMIGKAPREYPDGTLEDYAQLLDTVLASGKAGELEKIIRHPDGGMNVHQIHMVPERNKHGEVTGVLAIGRDITEHKRMEQAIAAREQEFRSLAESSPDFIVRYDREGRHLYLSDRLLKHLELGSAEEVIGKRPGEVWTDGRFAELERAAARAADSGNQVDIELVEPTEKGAFRYHQIFVVPERDVDGQIVGTLAFGREVTVIREAERRLKHFIDNLPGMAYTYRLSPDGHACFPFISPSAEKFYGLKPEDVQNDIAPLHRFWHPDDRPHIEAAAAEAARTMTPFRIEARVCRPGQPEHWLEARALPEREADGSILWYGLLLDITERIQAQQQMALLERAINQSSDAVFLVDEDIRFTYVNEAACRSLGYSREELLDLTPPDIDPDRTREMIMALMRNGTEKGSVFEARQQAKDGRIFPVELSGVTFKRDGKAFSLVTARDITERKHAEAQLSERLSEIEELNMNLEKSACDLRTQTEELATSQEHLKQTEAWYRGILHSAPDGMVVADAHGVITQVNAQIEEMFGYAAGELAGQPVELLLPPGVREGHVGKREDFSVATAGDGSKSARARGLRGYRKDGSEFPVDVSLSRLPDTDEKKGYVCAAIRDITERKKMERERKKMERERLNYSQRLEEISRNLVAAQEETRQRLARELHDRTSPNLAAIDINLNVIAAEIANGTLTDLTERLEDIRALISDTAVSIREVGAEMRPPLLDYAGLIAAMENHALLFARRTGIQIYFECKNKDTRYTPQIESLLFRIFQEALTNCSKHSSAQSIRISLCNDIHPNILSIADDGVGFDPAQLGKTGKIGLGLLNMREMAEVAGVKIAIESASGKGTCITVEI